MIISLNWLNEYVDISDFSVDDIVDKLTYAGLEVEDIKDYKKQFENFVVGYVKEKKKHPNADKLSLCIVNNGNEDINVICGAPNVEEGQKIAFAKVGAVIPENGFKLSKVKIRGEYSSGMICSEKELNISENHDGIMVLDPSLKEGTELASALGMDDTILDIAITPNRQDALSHVGIARDLAAMYDRELKMPKFEFAEDQRKADDFASVAIENSEDCPRYAAKVVLEVEVKDSPGWLKQKLISIGSRPINNIVDVTNFVLHELGQPLHAFDLDKLADQKIVVKSAGEQTSFMTLDSKERKLLPTDLMICDGQKSVAIAGVMGGENSEVTTETKNILIESAFFNPASIRKTAKHLGLSTDASYRFERGTDPEIVVLAAERAAQLIAELSGGKILNGTIDQYPDKIQHRKVKLRYLRITKILGYEIPNEEVKRILSNLSLEIIDGDENEIMVDVPPFRHDIEREIDLIEEVARIYGYENIPDVQKISITLDKTIDQSQYKDELRNHLTGMGFYEIITNSLLSEETAQKFGSAITILNPQSTEMANTRPSLLPGTLGTIARNLNVKQPNLSLFEIGNTFIKKNEVIKSFDDIEESTHLLLSITGKVNVDQWYTSEREVDFFDLKGFVNELLRKISLDNVLVDSYYHNNSLYLDYSLTKSYDGNVIAEGGKVKKEVLQLFDIDQDVFVFDINIDLLKKIPTTQKVYSEPLKYPKVVR
ncbi:MAG: phenylalanine--tRNA ligase subunit beta, partial [Melioribacteraceae bacterium]|nr:phenylalanine--tRNA ligase subunit beta [Melioribacteraceae bacterium]